MRHRGPEFSTHFPYKRRRDITRELRRYDYPTGGGAAGVGGGKDGTGAGPGPTHNDDPTRAGDPAAQPRERPKTYHRPQLSIQVYQPPEENDSSDDTADTDSEHGPGIDADLYGESVGVHHKGHIVRPAHERQDPSEDDRLAPICDTRLNLARLRELDSNEELRDVLDLITDPEAFRNALLPGARDHFRNKWRMISRHTLKHVDDLIAYGVIAIACTHAILTLPAFTVPKKSGGTRFIVDARTLNSYMARPPDMRLDDILEVTRRIAESTWVVLADARSCFYQFPVEEEIQRYFGIRFGDKRDEFVPAFLSVMCMGWSHSPAIANRSARVLLPPRDGIVWIDNFVVTAETLDEVQAKYRVFCERCDYVNATLNLDDADHGMPTQRFCTFGIQFDLVEHRFRMDPAWVAKVAQREELAETLEGTTTPRRAFRIFGSIVWQSYVMRAPLCFAPAILSFIRRIGRRAHDNNAAWDVNTRVPNSVIRETAARMEFMRDNNWHHQADPTSRATLWSDASSTEWAAILELGEETVTQGVFTGADRDAHIFLKEAFAVWQGLRIINSQDIAVTCNIDNLPLVFCMRRGHCANHRGNLLLQRIFLVARTKRLRLNPQWVPTDEQRADTYTRGTRAERAIRLEPAHIPTRSTT